MEIQKQYQQLKTALVGYRDKLANLQTELTRREGEQDDLENGALRAEVLGEADAGRKRDAADGNSSRSVFIRGEIERSLKAIAILEAEIQKITNVVLDELRGQHRPNMEKAYRAYVKKLREAAAAESEIRRVQEAADNAARSFGIALQLTLEPTGPIRCGLPDLIPPALERARLNGYDAE